MPADSNRRVKEEFVRDTLIYHMRGLPVYSLFGGDWNSVIRRKDVEPRDAGCVLGVLRDVLGGVGLTDVVRGEGWNVDHTYVRRGYAARLDRIYASPGLQVANTETINVVFSDHRGVVVDVGWGGLPKRYMSYWKLNVRLLDELEDGDSFVEWWTNEWTKGRKGGDTLRWWEEYAKPGIKNFYVRKGKEVSQWKYGLQRYLEGQLKQCYEGFSGVYPVQEIEGIKAQLMEMQNARFDGERMRGGLEDVLWGDKPSTCVLR
nr:uncharacterized protein LOC128705853 [Cherax quadricarinatus]